jgi:hypothetical protein
MSSHRVTPAHYTAGERLLRWCHDHVEVVEIVRSTGVAPWTRFLRMRYEDGSFGEGTPHELYLPGPLFDAFVAAHQRAFALRRPHGQPQSAEWAQAAQEAMKAEDAAFRAHPAGARWRDENPWTRWHL